VRLERDELGVPGGLQDQYAAVFGGFNFIEFEADRVLVNPLRLTDDVLAEFHGSLVLVPAPVQSRRSSGILNRQISQTSHQESDTMARLDRIKELAVEMKYRLLRGDLPGIGELLHEGWVAKRGLTAGITTDDIDALYAQARELGAVGGKLLGAGGGGYLLLMVPFDRRGGFVRELRQRDIAPLNFSFTDRGVQAWHADRGAGA
jgi:D-glycero-alpha-D-manno-heptose-7-phosphate kinase